MKPSFLRKYKIIKTISKKDNVSIIYAQQKEIPVYIYRFDFCRKTNHYRKYIDDYAVLKSMKHNGLIDISDIHKTKKNFFVVYSYDNYITMSDHILSPFSLSLPEQITIAKNIIDTVAAMHQKGISHLHVSIDNIVIQASSLTTKLNYFVDEKATNAKNLKDLDEQFRQDIEMIHQTLYQFFSWQIFEFMSNSFPPLINNIPIKVRQKEEVYYSKISELMEQLSAQEINLDTFAKQLGEVKVDEVKPDEKTVVELPSIPRTIAGYTIVEVLGKGGMGTIYKVWDEKLNKYLALKVISKLNEGKRNIRRFMREAQAIASLHHKNIVTIYNLQEEENICYFTMDFIDGVTLKTYAQQQKHLSFREIAGLFVKIANVLDYAHKNKIIHRDLKPSNIMVDKKGEIYLMDFGISKWGNDDKKLTVTGNILGTPFYMSPEQATGENDRLTLASDTYSLGVVLYEFLTGALPFEGDNVFQVMHKIQYESPPSLRDINATIPKELEKICLKAIEKNIYLRYQTASDMVVDLNSFANGKPVKIGFSLKYFLYRYYLKIATIIFICSLSLLFLLPKQEEPINITQNDKDYLLYIENLLENGLSTEAKKEIKHRIKIENSKTLQELLLVAHIDLGEYNEAIELYAKLQSEECLDIVYVAMMKMHCEIENWSDVDYFIEKLYLCSNISEFAMMEKLYMQGFLQFQKQHFSVAREYFDQALGLSGNNNTHLNAKLYQTICVYLSSQGDTKNIIAALENLNPSLPNNILLHEYLGKCYFEENLLEKALECFDKCIALKPEEALYYRYTSQVCSKLNLLDSALDHLQYALAIEHQDTELLEFLFKDNIVYPEKVLRFLEIIKKTTPKPFNSVFDLAIQKIAKRNYHYYIRYSQLSKQNSNWKNLVDIFIPQLNHQDQNISESAVMGLFTLRHQDNILNYLNDKRNELPDGDLKEKIKNISTGIEQQSLSEFYFATLYKIANFVLHQNRSLFKELNNEKTKKLLKGMVSKVENSRICYLAAKTLALLAEFDFLEEISVNEDIHTRIIVFIVLREFDIPAPCTFTDLDIDSIDNNFVLTLLAKSLCIRGEYNKTVHLETTKKLLISLMNNNNKIVSLHAACSLISFSEIEKEPVYDKAFFIVTKNMFGKNTKLRYIAHTYFWQTYKFRNEYQGHIYQKYVEKSVELNDEYIDFLLIATFLDYENIGSVFADDIIKIIERYTPGTWIRIKATYTLCSCSPDDPYVNKILQRGSEAFHFMERSFAFFSSTSHKMFGHFKNQQLYKLIEALQKLNNLCKELPLEKNVYYKIFTYHTLALMGIECIVNIDKENNSMIQSAILSGVAITLSFNNRVPIKVLTGIALTTDEKKAIIEPYTRSSNEDVKKAALWSQMAIETDENRNIIFNKYKHDEEMTKFLGLALLNTFHQKILNNLVLGRFSSPYDYSQNFLPMYVNIAQNLLFFNDFQGILKKSVPLAKEPFGYFFQALYIININKDNRDFIVYEEARKLIEHACTISKSHKEKNLYSIYLADVYYSLKKPKKAEEILSNLYLFDLSMLELMQITNIYFANNERKKAKRVLLSLFSKKTYERNYLILLPQIYAEESKDRYVLSFIDHIINIHQDFFATKVDPLQYDYFSEKPIFAKFLSHPELKQLQK